MPGIAANPNPLSIWAWSITHSATTQITWNTTDVGVEGKVYMKTDAGAEQLFDDGPHHADFANSKTSPRLELGKNYEFLLRRADDGTLLAQVAIVIEEKLGLPPSLVSMILSRVPWAQGITHLRVFPGVDTVRIRFDTRQPTTPFVDIKNVVTGDIVGGWLPLRYCCKNLY